MGQCGCVCVCVCVGVCVCVFKIVVYKAVSYFVLDEQSSGQMHGHSQPVDWKTLQSAQIGYKRIETKTFNQDSTVHFTCTSRSSSSVRQGILGRDTFIEMYH